MRSTMKIDFLCSVCNTELDIDYDAATRSCNGYEVHQKFVIKPCVRCTREALHPVNLIQSALDECNFINKNGLGKG